MYLEKDKLLWSPIFNKETEKALQRKGSWLVSEPKLALKEETRIVLAKQNIPEENYDYDL